MRACIRKTVAFTEKEAQYAAARERKVSFSWALGKAMGAFLIERASGKNLHELVDGALIEGRGFVASTMKQNLHEQRKDVMDSVIHDKAGVTHWKRLDIVFLVSFLQFFEFRGIPDLGDGLRLEVADDQAAASQATEEMPAKPTKKTKKKTKKRGAK